MKAKYTYQDVKDIVEERGYKLLDKEEDITNVKGFVLTETKILVKCPNNHEAYRVRFLNFKIGNCCKKCKYKELSKRQSFSYDEVKKEIESYGYKLHSLEYKNCKTPLEIECPCGHKLQMNFDHFKNQGNRCPYCYGNVKYTQEEVEKYVKSFGYELLSDYINCKEKIKLKHKECGCVFDTTYDHFKGSKNREGSRCPTCNGGSKHTIENIKIYALNYGWTLISTEYEDSYKKLHFQCSNGHDKYISFTDFKNDEKRKCKKCLNQEKTNEFKELAESLGYIFIEGFYENCESIFKLQCPKGHVFDIKYTNLKYKKGVCPCCKESRGEFEIRRVLNKNNIEFIKEYKFEDCKFKASLPFDFYLPNLNICIEFDGEYHYKAIDYFGGLDKFISRKINDTIKNKYCKDNNIKLIRIPYWDLNNIEEILELELNLR